MRCLEPRRQARACYFRAFFASLDVKSVSRFRASPAAMLTLSPVPPFSLFAPPSIHQRPRGCTRLLTALSARHPARSTPPLPATRLPSPTWAPSDLLTSPSGPRRSARRNVRHRLMRGSRLPSRNPVPRPDVAQSQRSPERSSTHRRPCRHPYLQNGPTRHVQERRHSRGTVRIGFQRISCRLPTRRVLSAVRSSTPSRHFAFLPWPARIFLSSSFTPACPTQEIRVRSFGRNKTGSRVWRATMCSTCARENRRVLPSPGRANTWTVEDMRCVTLTTRSAARSARRTEGAHSAETSAGAKLYDEDAISTS
ncbi:hypothetical protein BKA93DRAFT_104037 [Sparassis latifolia]